MSTLFRTGHIFEIKLNGADFFFFSKHVLSPESPGNRPHPHLPSYITGADSISAIRELAGKVNIPTGLKALNVREEDIPVLAANALKDACGLTNPIQATQEEIEAIFRAAM